MHWFTLLNIILMFFSLRLCSTSVLGNQLLKLSGLGPWHKVFFEILFQLDQVFSIWKLCTWRHMAIRNVSQQDCLQVRSFEVLCTVNFQYGVEKDFPPPGSLLSYCLSQQQAGERVSFSPEALSIHPCAFWTRERVFISLCSRQGTGKWEGQQPRGSVDGFRRGWGRYCHKEQRLENNEMVYRDKGNRIGLC